MSLPQELAIAKIATSLSPLSDSKVYVIDPSKDLKSNLPDVEFLSSNDSLSFIDEKFSTITNIDSKDFFQNLPVLTNSKDKKFIINVKVSNDDYSVVTAAKDLGFNLLISSNEKEAYDFSILAQLLSKNNGTSTIHFYIPSAKEIKQYSVESIKSLYESYNGKTLESAFKQLETISGKLYSEFELFSSSSWFSSKAEQVILLLGNPELFIKNLNFSSTALISIKVYRPFSVNNLEKVFSKLSAFNSILLLEQSSISLQYQSLFLSLIDLLPSFAKNGVKIIFSQILSLDASNIDSVFKSLISNSKLDNSIQNLILGKSFNEGKEISQSTIEASADGSYLRVLKESQKSFLNIMNDFTVNGSPEYAFGKYLYEEEQLKKLIKIVETNLSSFNGELNDELAKWLIKARDTSEVYDAQNLISLLESDNSTFAVELLSLKRYFTLKANWIIGSDNWSHDSGLATFHQLLSNGNNRLKLLIIDSDSSINPKQGKKNLGLYAMNYGNSYVASVALYSSYTQTLTSFLEANSYSKGPAIVLAYLPKSDNYLDMLKDTKKSVDTGYWPLYRFNPSLENIEDSFKLDSSSIKRELQDFLDKENRLSLLISKNSKLAYNLQSYNKKVEKATDENSKIAFKELLENLGGEPLTIAFASDGGNASNLANKLGRRATNKGLKVKVLAMDDLSLEDFSLETNVVFITSTSGQGEFPTNGKQFWESLKSSTADLATVRVSVFGLGDSKYWPRSEDAHYYNKPATDLFNKLTNLGATFLCDLGLGDDQDADGFNTGYNSWEPKLWESLNVSVENADEPPPITNEDMKINSNFLRGTIAEGLADTTTGAISSTDQQLTKFHGIYMQDDRDIRDERKKEGLEPAYAFMVRVRLPGGVSTPDQWLKIDELADIKGNHTFKITTRATYQLHGVVKKDLRDTIREINTTAMDTLGACGDVNRNVMIAALPHNQHLHAQMDKSSKLISAQLLPETTAYHEIWLTDLKEVARGIEGEPKKIKIGGNALQDSEPLYSPVYLPRKFKVVITMPPYNDVDVYAHDVGLIAIVENNNIIGYNVLVGGGMGTTHNNTKTYPRTGSLFGFVEYDKVSIVCEKIMIIQRDHGDRKNRKHARLKYTIDDMGVEVYKSKVEDLLGFKFQAAKPFKLDSNIDYFGWCQDELGLNHYTCFVENGRVEDVVGKPQKTGLKKIAEYFKKHDAGKFRLTGNQHILLSDIPDEHLDTIKKLLHDHNLDNLDHSALRLSSGSCVAFPTCGLAMAEAERYLPQLIEKLEVELEKLGLRNDSVVMRMTGCPNGCARPWMAEIALVGKSYGYYNLMLGGGYTGDRLNKLYKTNVDEEEIMNTLVPLFARWANERLEGEHFGDFVIRSGVIKPTLEGKYFWDDLNDDI